MNSQQARILQLIANRIGSHPSLDTNIDELGLDSLAMAELMYDIESTFQIHTDDGILELDTVQDLCDYLEAHLGAEGATRAPVESSVDHRTGLQRLKWWWVIDSSCGCLEGSGN